jgi:hypothetical protein
MKSPRAARGALRQQDYGLNPGTAVVLYLHTPKEKVWGLLLSTMTAGVVVRGLDIAAFEDWLRQEVRGDDHLLAPSTAFYPMHRVHRMEKDETIGPIPSYSERFRLEVGHTVEEAMGIAPESGDEPEGPA